MSDKGNTDSTTQAILKGLSDALPVIETVAGVLFPGAAAAASMGVKIAQGVIAAEPTAIALYQQFTSGEPPTQAQLEAYAAGEDSAYAQLTADLDAADKRGDGA